MDAELSFSGLIPAQSFDRRDYPIEIDQIKLVCKAAIQRSLSF